MKNLLFFNFLPSSTSLGLLVLRLWLGLPMILLHGLMKLQKFDQLKGGFPDPLNIGHQNSLTLAILGEVVAAAFVVLGLFTRGAALTVAITMAVAFFMAHSGKLSGEGNGELAFIYLAGFVVLFITGAGRYSLDHKLGAKA